MSAFTNRQMRRHPEMFGIALYAPDADDAPAGAGSSSATAVMDKPAAGLTTDAGAAEGAEGDDTKEDAAAVSGETKTGEGEKPKTPVLDEDTEAILAARIEEDRIERDRAAAETKSQQDAEAAETAHQEELRNHFATHKTTLTEALDGIGVVIDGETYRLGQTTKDELLGVLTAYDKDAQASIGLRLRETLTSQVLAHVPEADRAAAKKTLDDADPAEFMNVAGEVYAPRAAALGEMDLDGVLGLSPKAKRGHLEALKVAKDEAKLAERERIYALHGITQDEPETGNGGGVSSGFANLNALNAAKLAGRINDAEFLKEQNKLLGVS
jgi:hypothetical protein